MPAMAMVSPSITRAVPDRVGERGLVKARAKAPVVRKAQRRMSRRTPGDRDMPAIRRQASFGQVKAVWPGRSERAGQQGEAAAGTRALGGLLCSAREEESVVGKMPVAAREPIASRYVLVTGGKRGVCRQLRVQHGEQQLSRLAGHPHQHVVESDCRPRWHSCARRRGLSASLSLAVASEHRLELGPEECGVCPHLAGVSSLVQGIGQTAAKFYEAQRLPGRRQPRRVFEWCWAAAAFPRSAALATTPARDRKKPRDHCQAVALCESARCNHDRMWKSHRMAA